MVGRMDPVDAVVVEVGVSMEVAVVLVVAAGSVMAGEAVAATRLDPRSQRGEMK